MEYFINDYNIAATPSSDQAVTTTKLGRSHAIWTESKRKEMHISVLSDVFVCKSSVILCVRVREGAYN